MAKNRKKSGGVASLYARWRGRLAGNDADPAEARAAAGEMRRFGLDGERFIRHKLGSAAPGELPLLLDLARHFDSPEVVEGLRDVVLNRTVPLALKRKCFEVMAELGQPLEDSFLRQLSEAEETYIQLSSLLRKSDEKSLRRGLSLADDFLSMPVAVKRSFLLDLRRELGGRAMPFFLNIAGRDGEIDPLLVDFISEEGGSEAVDVLNRIAERGGDKECVKRARRAIYKLRQKGVVALEKEEPRPEAPSSEEGEQAYASGIDSFGNRLLLLALPGLGELLVCEAAVVEARGLVRFSAAKMSRRSFRELLKEFREESQNDKNLYLGAIDSKHCRWLLEEAYGWNRESGTLVPERYKGLRYRLRPPEGHDPTEFLARRLRVGEDEVRGVSARLEEIFAVPEVGVWIIDRESLLSYAHRFIELEGSKLVISEEQRRQRLQDVISDFTSEYFDERRLKATVRRLEETAYLLSLRGRDKESSLLAALARDVAGSSFLKPHPFLNDFMSRSIFGIIRALSQEAEEKRSSGEGRIIRQDRL